MVIAGGGPAGVSCAFWLKKLGVDCVLLEASDSLGGLQLRSPYENLWIPGVQAKTGQQVAHDLERRARDVSVDIRPVCRVLSVTADGRKVETSNGGFTTPHLVLATGSTPRTGGFKPAANVAIGPGVSMEAIEVRGRRVAILGGGDNAFDQARFARDRGGDVTVIARSAPRAQGTLQDMIPDVEVVAGP